jgi:hypothetical protein
LVASATDAERGASALVTSAGVRPDPLDRYFEGATRAYPTFGIGSCNKAGGSAILRRVLDAVAAVDGCHGFK